MRTRHIRGLAFLSTLALLLLALATAAPALAQGSGDCTLKVSPRSGGPGTEFAFSGSGYTPTKLVLKRKGGPVKTVQVPATSSDSFTVRLIAGQGDTGTWTATAVDPDTCSASARFSVGLPPTATLSDTSGQTRDLALAAFAALGAIFVASSLVVLPRMTRSARNR
ncbi:MAG: hypothetical protein U0869_25920 [Chloroflexota bacterium]